MAGNRRTLSWAYWGVTLATLVAALAMAAFYAPVDPTMGPAQKIVYLHLPVAFNMFVACLVTFVASVGFLWQRAGWWDDLADAGARVAVLYCSVVILTGMVWAKNAWGQWWVWSPRLTFCLILWLLFVAYLAIRPAILPRPRRALVSAVYGIVAFLDVPLVYLSVKLLPDIHPDRIPLDEPMRWTLAAWFVPASLLCVGLIGARFTLSRRAHGSEDAAAEAREDLGRVAATGGRP
jgi:heme exporter protein C